MSENDSIHPSNEDTPSIQEETQSASDSQREDSSAHVETATESEAPASQGLSDLMADFDFSPKWAKGDSPSSAKWEKYERVDYSEDRRSRRGGGDRDRSRREGRSGEPGRKPSGREDRGRPPRREGPRDTKAGESRVGEDRPARRGPPREARQHGEGRMSRSFPPRLPVRIDFLPDRTVLGKIATILRNSLQAAPLVNIAKRFLNHPDTLLVRVQPREGTPPEKALIFYQIKEDGAFFMDRAEAEAVAIRKGLELHFESAEVEISPPSGNFTCVAKCGMTGELLGPPNHHSYAEAIERIRGERCPEVPLEQYKRRIIMMHEPEAVEAWKQAQTHVTLYGEKGAEEKTMSRREAEYAVRTKHLSSMLLETRRIIAPLRMALAIRDDAFQRQVRDCLERDRERPFSILLALRPALKHQKFHFFKAREGMVFVSAAAPTPLDPAQVAGPIKAVLECLAANPGIKRDALLETLHPGATRESQESSQLSSHLRWLMEKGHVIEFEGGVYELPRPRAENVDGKKTTPAGSAEAGKSAEADAVNEMEPSVGTPEEPVVAEGDVGAHAPSEESEEILEEALPPSPGTEEEPSNLEGSGTDIS